MTISHPVLIATRECPSRLPPVLSLLTICAELSQHVVCVVDSIEARTRDTLEQRGITVVEASPSATPSQGGVVAKGIRYLRYRRVLWSTLRSMDRDCVLWIASADTAFAAGAGLLKRNYILGLLELYDRHPLHRRLLRPYVRNATCVVTPEPCRSAIFRVWYQLSHTPMVIPNRPYDVADQRRMPVEDAASREKLIALAGRKLLLYQARGVRMETFDIAEAIRLHLGDDFVLGILGAIRDKEGFERLRAVYPQVVHFDYIPAPMHLAVTRHAYIGLLIYNYESLNNIFCAPNKVWEYAALGLPMICHELPMLSEQLARFHAGATFASGDPASVANAVREIEADYEAYCAGATALFRSVDMKALVLKALQGAAGARGNPNRLHR